MAASIRRPWSWWSGIREPSLVRRLLLAQLAWMVGLWLLFAALVV